MAVEDPGGTACLIWDKGTEYIVNADAREWGNILSPISIIGATKALKGVKKSGNVVKLGEHHLIKDAVKHITDIGSQGSKLGNSAAHIFIDPNSAKRTSRFTVLGNYPDYIDLGNKTGARYFSVPQKIWEKMSETQQWTANLEFLKRTKKQEAIIVLSNSGKNSKGRSFPKEIKFLERDGYTLSKSGRVMFPPQK